MNTYNTVKQAEQNEGIIHGYDSENEFDNENDAITAAEKHYPDGGVFVVFRNGKYRIAWTA